MEVHLHITLILLYFNFSRNVDMEYATVDSRGSGKETNRSSSLPRPQRLVESDHFGHLHIHLKAVLQGITIGASLLPSLKAQHKVSNTVKPG